MKKQTMRLALQDISLDSRLQPRVQIDDERVQAYAERMEAGDTFPPVTVFYDSTTYWLADGFHRFYAMRDRRETGIMADIIAGSFHDALEHSVSANAAHGLPRTRADVRRAAATLLCDDVWMVRSDTWLAEVVKCSKNTVASERERLESTSQIDYCSELLAKDGRWIPRESAKRISAPTIERIPFEEELPALDHGQDYDELLEDIADHYAERESPVIHFQEPDEEPTPEPTGPRSPDGGFILNEWNDLTKAEQAAALAVMHHPTGRTFNEQKDGDNIEWARWSWNPITGCKHNCIYCYARDIANRFYAQQFEPTIIPERLAIPYHQPVPAVEAPGYKNVFTCSMADLWGRWVPQEWIDAVLRAVRDNQQWNFLMLTKFPMRMAEQEWPENAWVGTSVDSQVRVAAAEKAFAKVKSGVKWLSCEPLTEPLKFSSLAMFDWVVIGAQTRSTQAPEFQPPWEWVEDLMWQARQAGCKVYLKTNVIGRPREYPV